MIPPFGPKETGSAGEKTVYSILANGLPDEFTVIHSLPWLSAAVRQNDAGTAPTGEIDFLVLHPDLGALVPQGSRLIGQYDSQVAYGQRRVLLVWTRLIHPDGSSLVLDRLPTTDVAGQSGLEDRVDWHWNRIFAGAALSTLIDVGAELAAPDRVDADGRIVIATRESVQETVNQVGQQVTRRNLDLQPTLTVRAGFPVRVVVNHDLMLQPFAEDRDVSQLDAPKRQ